MRASVDLNLHFNLNMNLPSAVSGPGEGLAKQGTSNLHFAHEFKSKLKSKFKDTLARG